MSVELNPDTCNRLALNLALNELREVRALNVAIGGRPDITRFSPSATSVEDNLFAQPSADAVVFEVRVVTLEGMLNEYAAPGAFFDLLKIDCEGAEYEIIAATPVEILRRFRAVVMELHPPPDGYASQGLVQKMEMAGFRTEQMQDSSSGAELHFWTRQPTAAAEEGR